MNPILEDEYEPVDEAAYAERLEAEGEWVYEQTLEKEGEL